jgi:UDP-glucose 4-epimerase
MLSPYAVSKYAGENYCKAFYENYGLSTTAVRYSNVYGPGQSAANPYCGVIGKFLESVSLDRPLQIHGDGDQTRDYTYVDDVVEATILAAVSTKADGQVYNVATGREISINQLVGMIRTIADKTVTVEYLDRRDIDNVRRRVLNVEKIRRELRWTPSVTLERGLASTYRWLLEEKAQATAR